LSEGRSILFRVESHLENSCLEEATQYRVQVNQHNRFLPNVCKFLLPARPQWLKPAGGERKSAVVEQNTVMLIYPYPKIHWEKQKKKCSKVLKEDRKIIMFNRNRP